MAVEARPAQPKTVLRGHKAPVHAAAFCRRNERLMTGDAEGFVAAWDLTIMRPRAVWQAHTNAILGISGWGDEKIITHGRDNRLIVWKLTAEDEANLSTVLPLDPCAEARPQPWIIHLLEVNTMNFCRFSWCPTIPVASVLAPPSEILAAVPNTLASEAIDVFQLPSQVRQHTVRLGEKNGMVMALSLFYRGDCLTLAAGYENGLAVVAQLDCQGAWNVKYKAQCHSQPVLSLDLSPNADYFFTSGADDVIAKHPVPLHALVAPDNKGSSENAPEPTSELYISQGERGQLPSQSRSGGSLLAAALAKQNGTSAKTSTGTKIDTEPLKLVKTKHSGQQGLQIRSDSRIFATAGWDSKVRVYSVKSMKEVAVLKWHQVGCYVTAFAEVQRDEESSMASRPMTHHREEDFAEDGEASGMVVPKLANLSVRDKRIGQAKTLHWLAAGSKDGRVSLWDVF